MARYKVSHNKHEIGHSCCYDVCIIDTTQPYPYREGTFYAICECKDEAIAEQICDALNVLEHVS